MLLEMFTIWKMNFGSKMNAENWDITKAQVWAMALQDLGWSEKRQAIAQKKSLQLNWMPSTPKDFYQLAVSELVPSSREAYLDACEQVYHTAIAYQTAKRVGFYDLRHKSEKDTWQRWQHEFVAVCDEFMAGKTFTLPKGKQIEFKPSKPKLSDEMSQKIDDFFARYGKRKQEMTA